MNNLNTTPLVFLGQSWVPMLVPGKTLEWGHRFDAGIGYRVFVKYAGADFINAFVADKAREIARDLRKSKDEAVQALAMHMMLTAAAADKMNALWVDAGAPDVPVDQISEAGHA